LLAAILVTPASAQDSHPVGQTVRLPGVDLYYTDTGGPGTPVILLHANTGTSDNWDRQNEAFAQAGYRVIAFDRRGWGKSFANPATGPQPGSVAGDLDALVDALKLPKFHLVGVAGGGFVALDYMHWRPEKVRSAVVAASTGSIQEREITEFSARIALPGLTDLPGARGYREVGASYRGGNPEGYKEWQEIEEHAQQPGSPSQPLRNPNNWQKLSEIHTPVLVMPGDSDLISPPALMKVWYERMPNAEWAIVKDAGHSIAWEQPKEFNENTLYFINRH
jgi:pimeloyl-ACP methyl ester carboxylesterase